MAGHQEGLWEDPPYQQRGEVRRALDRSIVAAKKAGAEFLDVEVTALRRQANDLDRLERLVQAKGAKTWDYTPKTQAHAAFSDAVARVFGRDSSSRDEFADALEQFMRAEGEHDPTRPEPAD